MTIVIGKIVIVNWLKIEADKNIHIAVINKLLGLNILKKLIIIIALSK